MTPLHRDLDLLARWAEGDDQAGLALLDHYRGLFFKTCVRFGLTAEDEILELHQDLVLRLLQQRQQLAGRLTSSFAGFLVWQVRDLVQRRRKLERRAPRSLDPLQGNPPQPTPVSPPDTARVDLWDAIHRCWQQLPPREHEVFRLRYLEGQDLATIAAALLSNANAIAQAVFRLSRRMRACLRLHGLDEEFA